MFGMTLTRRGLRHDWGLATIIIGAGDAGRTLARDLRHNSGYGLRPVGFLDDDTRRRVVAGLPVLAPLAGMAEAAGRSGAKAVIIAIPSLPTARVRALSDEAATLGLRVCYLPSFLAAMERDARGSDLRRLNIPLLLGREELHVVRHSARELVRGRRVLVTGAGGSIGSELCRQVRAFGPAGLFLLDHDESNLHRLQLEITGEALLDDDDIVIADIRDQVRVDQVMRRYQPEVVLHAAAHKHLPLLERHPSEGVKSNVLGTQHLLEASLAHGVERFLLISTDKAADPTSVLGATKRLAEMLVQANAIGSTALGSVRFGNVLGSRGSFLSVVAEQIQRGEPVTVTHPEVTRFFMTVEEAVGLVLEAAGMAEFGETFVLDMGEPVRIVDLVTNYGRQLQIPDVPVRFTGLRPGEKLDETVFAAEEQRTRTGHPKIWATHGAPLPPDLPALLPQLYAAAEVNDDDDVRAALAALIPEYRPAQPVASRRAFATPYPDGY